MTPWQHFVEKLPGVLGLKAGHAFALGHTANLPTCEDRRRGEERLVKGGAGVGDRRVLCRKDAADAYAWWDAPLGLTDVGGITSILTGTTTYDPPSLASNAGTTTTLTVTGAAQGDRCGCGHTSVAQAMEQDCSVSGADTCTYILTNRTGGTVNLGSGTLRCDVVKH